ncbi:ethanolamine utilization protein [Verticiella sediminum]|uniref:Excinuclease cho n=1 Tax=Verticiella sediminum TaxID=1247510 RepID=A0A556AXK8_9BURK|nr:exonuclease domain-containing protein [Verticiella sediminum]TSH97677.1 ethanolamine utilization protein [Verticiella sediminum]
MQQHSFPDLAFVDIETTGGSAQHDRITEIAVVRVGHDGVHEWRSFVNPGCPIPRAIQSLTGITDAMVADAPPFEALAGELVGLLSGHVFVAHNARFDYGFIKNAFARMDADFRANVLCTVRLSRRLYPQADSHSLDALIARHGLRMGEADGGRHRALGDARAIHAFWEMARTEFAPELLLQTVRKLCELPSLPPALPAELPEQLPNAPGVYRFEDERGAPLYIGKAVDLRRRVLSHFSGDHRRTASMELSQQVRRVAWTETASELEALLVEASQVKALAPLYNRQLRPRQNTYAWRLVPDLVSGQLVLTGANDPGIGVDAEVYGLFASRAAARGWLRERVDEHGLCAVHTGLEKQTPGKPCFARQLRRCLGACLGHEPTHLHYARLCEALAPHRVEPWPYGGPIALPGNGGVLHVLNRWAYVGTAQDAQEAAVLAREAPPRFDADVYRILRAAREELEQRAQPVRPLIMPDLDREAGPIAVTA